MMHYETKPITNPQKTDAYVTKPMKNEKRESAGTLSLKLSQLHA
jgi:hypothetical protein